MRLWAAWLTALASAPAASQIYVNLDARRDDAKTIVLSNFHSDSTPELLIAEPPALVREGAAPTAPGPPIAPATVTARHLPAAPAHLVQLVESVALQVDFPAALLHAVVAAESGYDSRALSARGAIGLMQLMPATARRFGVVDAYAPRANLAAGALYLKGLLALFDGDLELALAAYNAGEQAVIKAGRRVPPYPETQAYVPRVMAYLRCAQDRACETARGRRTPPPSSWGAARNLSGG